MPDETNKDEMETAKEPFPFEITPEKFVVPPDGVLHVTIKNPDTGEGPYKKVNIYFDSFFFLIHTPNDGLIGTNIKNNGCSISSLSVEASISPDGIYSFSVGYFDGKYTRSRGPDECEGDLYVNVDAVPNKRIYYNRERPEGVIVFVDEDSGKRMKKELFLEEVTEKYEKFKEQLLEIRKNQERMARWGHVLKTGDCGTGKHYKDDDGKLHNAFDIRKIIFPKHEEVAREKHWEEDILTDLKEIDKMTDEEIRELKKTRREKLVDDWDEEQNLIKGEKGFRQERDKEYEKRKKEEEKVRKLEEEKAEKLEKEEEAAKRAERAAERAEKAKARKEQKQQFERMAQCFEQFNAQKAAEKSPQKTVEIQKPPKSKVTKAPKSNIKKIKQKELSVKKSVEPVVQKPEEKKSLIMENKNIEIKEKKKKTNPCCVLL